MEAARRREDPWGGSPWQVPLATFLTLVGLMSLLRLLVPSDLPPPAQRPLDVEVAELPPRIVAPPPTAPKPATRPMPPAVRERHRVEIPPPVEPLPQWRRWRRRPPSLRSRSTRPGRRSRRETPLSRRRPREPQPAAPSTATSKSDQEGDRASRAPSETARDPVPGPRGEALGGGNTGARAISQPLPEIPEALRHRSIEIIAVALFKVAANGSAQVELTGPTAMPI